MANTFFKPFAETDRTSSRTLLHEVIPITGSIVSGTYSGNNNIKTFSHGMFKSVYDYPHQSSSANHIFDVSFGYHMSSSYSGSSSNQNAKKLNMYNQMAQVLVGYDTNGNIRMFDKDGNFTNTTTDKLKSAFFMNFSRLLVKDEIKKGSFSMTLGTSSAYGNASHVATVTLTDSGAESSYLINSPAGEYGLLYTSSTPGAGDGSYGDPFGLIYYQAGVIVLTSSCMGATGTTKLFTSRNLANIATGSNIDIASDALLHRITNIQFNNTTELNSTIYFCRANHNEFNYSSNPTYLKSSKIVVKGNNELTPPRSYVTTVGLYSADNELLAVAKLSEPLRKDPTNELTLRVRLDY
tara:strand:+ start:62223 stop:63278 length:1056 start_codon:yes stop_codon:yes gene_type:complete